MSELSPEKKRLYTLVSLAFFAALFELMAWGVVAYFEHRGLLFAPPTHSASALSYADYMAARDPFLGWPAKSQLGTKAYDAGGARPDATAPAGPPCAVTFGDSFTYSEEVEDDQTWESIVAKSLGCRVANYGVPGYGTDQALMRYRITAHPPGVAVLGHHSDDIGRNLNRDRDLLWRSVNYAQKPRFILTSTGGLQLVPLPVLSETEYLRSVGLAEPPLRLEHESFQEGGPMVFSAGFPHLVTLFTALRDFRVKASLLRQPDYAQLYRPDHPLGGLQLTVAIIETFLREARARGDRPVIVLFITRYDIDLRRKLGTWTYAPLVDALKAKNIDFVDMGPVIEQLLDGKDPAPYFMPRNHYGPEINREIARVMTDKMR